MTIDGVPWRRYLRYCAEALAFLAAIGLAANGLAWLIAWLVR